MVCSIESSAHHLGFQFNKFLLLEISSCKNLDSFCVISSWTLIWNLRPVLLIISIISWTDIGVVSSGPKFQEPWNFSGFESNFLANSMYPKIGSKTCCQGLTDFGFRITSSVFS